MHLVRQQWNKGRVQKKSMKLQTASVVRQQWIYLLLLGWLKKHKVIKVKKVPHFPIVWELTVTEILAGRPNEVP